MEKSLKKNDFHLAVAIDSRKKYSWLSADFLLVTTGCHQTKRSSDNTDNRLSADTSKTLSRMEFPIIINCTSPFLF